MTRISVWQAGAIAAALLTATGQPGAFAQSLDDPGGGGFGGEVIPLVDWDKRLNIAERLQPLGNDLFGDRIDPHTGSVDFLQTDIVLPGNSGLEVALHRRNRQGRQFGLDEAAFGDWELVVPRILVVTADSQPWTGARCSIPFNDQFDTVWTTDQNPVSDHEYSNGVTLEVGGSSEQVLENPRAAPWPAGATHVTNSNWYFTCHGSGGVIIGDTGGTGGEVEEYFVGHAPDGTTYRFDRHIVRDAMPLGLFNDNSGIHRDTHILAATEVSDAHGNWVRYSYSSNGSLTRIYANDGRSIDLTYHPNSRRIATASANGRTWTYSYATSNFNDGGWVPLTYRGGGHVLTRVDLPDGRFWTFDMAAFQISTPPSTYCLSGAGGSMTHPSGAQGVFSAAQTKLRVSYNDQMSAPPHCPDAELELAPSDGTWSVINQSVTPVISITEKTISGPGLPTLTWTYEYEQDIETGTESDNRTNWTRVTGPESVVTYYHRWRTEAEGGAQLKQEVRETAAGAVMETVTTSYLVEARFGDPGPRGSTPINLSALRRQPALVVRNRGGDVYQSEFTYVTDPLASSYSFGHPVRTRTWSSLSGATQRITETTYQRRTSPWVLALPSRVVRNSRTVYDITYDTRGLPTAIHHFGVQAETRGYNTDGTLAWMRDALGRQTSFANYHRGQPRTITRPDSVQILVTVDNNGWITGVTNARGYTTSYGYNASGWLTSINRPAPLADTAISYSGLTQTLTTGSVRETVSHDAFYRPLLVQRQAISGGGGSIFTRTAYDGEGRVAFTSFPSATSTTTAGTDTSYDALGRVVQVRETVSPYATTATAYLSGNRVRVTDPSGAVTTTTRMGYAGPDDGEPVRIEQPLGVVTTMTYTPLGSLASATQAGGGLSFTQTWAYDSRERVCRHVTPETGASLYLYDAAGQMTAMAAGQPAGAACGSLPSSARIAFGYDALGRPILTDFPDTTPDIALAYDANSNLTRAERGTSLWTYAYDAGDRLVSEHLGIDGRIYAIGYSWNGNDALVSETTPAGRTVSYHPDGHGRPTAAVADGLAHASGGLYHPSGALSRLDYANGHRFTAVYDARHLLASMRVARTGVTALDLSYTRDVLGRVASITDAAVAGQNRSFGYDGLGRLVDADGPWGQGSYTYDALNNITAMSEGSSLTELAYTAQNRLDTVSVTEGSGEEGGTLVRSYAHDARGNVTGNGRLSFVYDLSNRPASISGAASGTFVYDAHGRRVRQTIDGEAIYSVYTLSGRLAYRETPALAQGTDYVRLGARTVVRLRTEQGQSQDGRGTVSVTTATYPHDDHLGSASAASDASGQIVFREHYSPWGRPQVGDWRNRDDQGFTGHIADAATGLVYMQARYYDPAIGRFLSSDPVGFASGGPAYFNRYAYVANDPVNAADPTGMWIEDLFIGVPSAAIGVWSAGRNALQGNWGAAAVDGAGVIADIGAIAVPGVPGGVGLGIQATRGGLNALDAGVDAARAIDQPAGVVYRRTNSQTGRCYIGRCNSEELYTRRQRDHERENPDAEYTFRRIDRAEPGQALREAEQRQIDAHGGPTNRSNPDGGTENRRNEIRTPRTGTLIKG